MKPVKDPINPHLFKGVYEISYSCGRSYIRETGHPFRARIKEHESDIRLNRTQSFALTEHSHNTKQLLCLEDTKVLTKEDNYTFRNVMSPSN